MKALLQNLFVPLALLLTLNAQRSTAAAQPTITQLAAGSGGFTLFITADGSLWGMGDNTFDELGASAGDMTFAQRLVSSNVTAIAGGGYHTLFLKSNGSLWAMGDNYYGELGDPSDNGTQPQQIVPANVTAIAAGGSFSLFLTSGGGLWAMGDNTYGQLGNGTVLQQNSPVSILPGGVAAIAAGGSHSLLLKTDGSLWAMGYNAYGQLGDGYLTNSPFRLTRDESTSKVAACLEPFSAVLPRSRSRFQLSRRSSPFQRTFAHRTLRLRKV